VKPIPVPASTEPRDAERFVLRLDRRLERLDRAILVAEWDLYTGRSELGSGRWQLPRSQLLSDPRLLGWLRAARARTWPPLLERRLELLERVVLDTQVEQDPEVVRLREELNRTIVAFRPSWGGRRVNRETVHRVLLTDPNRARRRRAFYSHEPLYRALEERFRRLVRLRNDKARAAGFRSFAEMRLGFQGFSPERVLDLGEAATRAARSRARRLRDVFAESSGEGGWYPWDLRYAQHLLARLPERSFPRRPMLPRILAAVRQWGFRTDRMRFRVVFHDLPAGGLTLAPDPPQDVRILVHPQGGWQAYLVMFHEVGHAVHSASIRSPRHLLRWHENVPGFGGFHEGIGGLFEEVPLDPAWLAAQAGVGRSLAEEFATSRADSDLLSAAWLNTWIAPELSLYRDPDRNPAGAAGRLARRLFGYDTFAPVSFVDSFYVADPVYSANYLLAALFHHQIAQAIRDDLGEPLWPNRKVGPWLTRNWFAPGSVIEWVPHVKAVTGRPFSARAFCTRFSAT